MYLCAKIKYLWQNMTLEPVVLLFAINFGFFAIAGDQLYVNKMCEVNLGHSKEICDTVNVNPEYKDIMIENQKAVTLLKTTSRTIQAVPSVLYPLIAGPICDKYGRKPFIIISILGYTISTTVFLINTIWWHELKAEYLLFECIQGTLKVVR